MKPCQASHTPAERLRHRAVVCLWVFIAGVTASGCSVVESATTGDAQIAHSMDLATIQGEIEVQLVGGRTLHLNEHVLVGDTLHAKGQEIVEGGTIRYSGKIHRDRITWYRPWDESEAGTTVLTIVAIGAVGILAFVVFGALAGGIFDGLLSILE